MVEELHPIISILAPLRGRYYLTRVEELYTITSIILPYPPTDLQKKWWGISWSTACRENICKIETAFLRPTTVPPCLQWLIAMVEVVGSREGFHQKKRYISTVIVRRVLTWHGHEVTWAWCGVIPHAVRGSGTVPLFGQKIGTVPLSWYEMGTRWHGMVWREIPCHDWGTVPFFG